MRFKHEMKTTCINAKTTNLICAPWTAAQPFAPISNSLMLRRLLFLVLALALNGSLALAADPVLVNPPVTVRENRTVALSLFTTEVTFSEAPAEAGTAGLSERTANFYVASSGAHSFNDTFALRGLTNTPIFGDPVVTFYLDDVPLGGGFTTPDAFGGAAVAQLHRGPGQNTAFGLAGSAGVVQLSTPEPGERAKGRLGLRAGNFSARDVSAQISSASKRGATAFVSAQFGTRDGYLYSQTLGHDVDHRRSGTGLARLSYAPVDNLKLTLIAQATRARDGEQPLVPLNGPMDILDRKSQGETHLDSTTTGLTAAVTQPWGHLSFTSSINDWQLGPYRSFLTFGPAELLNDVQLSQRNYNQEVKFSSSNKEGLRWHSGLIFSEGTTNGAFTRAFGSFVLEDSSYEIATRRLAAYGEASLAPRPGLTVTAGLRLERAEKSFDRREHIPSLHAYSLTHDARALLPKLQLDYSPRPNLRLFSSLGAGFKPGGFSAFTGNRALSAFGPERTVAFESGISQISFKNTLSWTVRAFAYEIRGYQIERSFATGSLADDYLVVNAPKARSTGMELELAWRPVQGLSLSIDYGSTHVTLREFTDPFTGVRYDGNRAPYVPRYDYNLRCGYRHATGGFILLKASANGRTDYTEAENKAFAQDSYSLFGGRLGFAASHWQVAFYVENLLNERYYSSISAGTSHGTPGAPRTQGVEARFHF